MHYHFHDLFLEGQGKDPESITKRLRCNLNIGWLVIYLMTDAFAYQRPKIAGYTGITDRIRKEMKNFGLIL